MLVNLGSAIWGMQIFFWYGYIEMREKGIVVTGRLYVWSTLDRFEVGEAGVLRVQVVGGEQHFEVPERADGKVASILEQHNLRS